MQIVKTSLNWVDKNVGLETVTPRTDSYLICAHYSSTNLQDDSNCSPVFIYLSSYTQSKVLLNLTVSLVNVGFTLVYILNIDTDIF
jgi:hypothetical protein